MRPFGGGGFQLNPGAGNRDFWTGGVAVTRQVTERLYLGAEITHQSRDSEDGRDFTGANLGVIYKLSDHWSLLASGGPGLQDARNQGLYDFYVSLKADYCGATTSTSKVPGTGVGRPPATAGGAYCAVGR